MINKIIIIIAIFIIFLTAMFFATKPRVGVDTSNKSSKIPLGIIEDRENYENK